MMRGQAIITAPISLEIVFILPIPQSWSESKKQLARSRKLLPGVRPDLDNFVKAILDALNTVVWKDDASICHMNVLKIYGNTPSIHLAVSTMAEVQLEERFSTLKLETL